MPLVSPPLDAESREWLEGLRADGPTRDEAVARLHGDWKGDVAAYDKVHVHMLHLADLLSTGLVAQFPRRFR